MARLTLSSLSKTFAYQEVISGIDLDIADGEMVCLLGPSGSGKSTLLRMVGGFETPSAGAVMIDGQDVTGLAPERRPTAMVFQSHALWSHWDVAANIAFGLKLRRLPRTEIARKVEEMLSLVGLEGYGRRRVWQLSGGQQQRVALARALALEPKILLLDEPFASLDQHLRERLRAELRDIQRRLGITALFVTHGQDEALALADRIVVLSGGRIEQADTPDRIYRAPATRFVAGFIGSMNFLPVEMRGGRHDDPLFGLRAMVPDGPAELGVRPEAVSLNADPASPAHIHDITDFGTHLAVELMLPEGLRLKAMCPPGERWHRGQKVRPAITAAQLFRDGAALRAGVRPDTAHLHRKTAHV